MENKDFDGHLDRQRNMLHKKLYNWLLKIWKCVGFQNEMIMKGQGKQGKAFDKRIQFEDLKSNAYSSLCTHIDDRIENSDEQNSNSKDLFDDDEVIDKTVKCISNN